MNLFYHYYTLLCTALCAMLLLTTATAQTTRYVAPSAAGSANGSSWANASANLQAMIDASASGDAVWVAAGTYRPAAYPTGCSDCATTRDYAFSLKDGVSVYGGFVGNETILSQRNVAANTTILSGDIGTIGNITDNTYHVVLAAFASTTPTTRLDGFTITAGNASDYTIITVNAQSIDQSSGAGIHAFKGSNTIANNTFSANTTANFGGGIYATVGTNTLTNNTFTGNTAGAGAGISISFSTTTVTGNTFLGNTSQMGGGIYIENGTSTLTNNYLFGNMASTFNAGGGIYTTGGTNTLTNNVLSGNTANQGGGIYSNLGINTFTNNTLSGNKATTFGGGMYVNQGSGTFTNNLFWGNLQGGSATVQGADYYAETYNFNTFNNNIFQLAEANYPRNSTLNYGIGTTAPGNVFAQNPQFVDADGADNIVGTADDNLRLACSSAAYNTGTNTSATTLDILGNAIFATTKDIGAFESQVNIAAPSFSITGATSGVGSVTLTATVSDPFSWSGGNTPTAATNTFTTSGTYTLTVTGANGCSISPSVRVTICPAGTTLYVDASAAANGAGTSWGTAFQTLDAALTAAWNCPTITTINVAAATYKPTLKPFNSDGTNMTTPNARDVTFHLRDGLSLYGGYPAGGGTRNIAANPTILSGDIGTANVTTDNCFHVVLAAFANAMPTTRLDGFTITRGNANVFSTIDVNAQTISRSSGGGVYTRNGTNILANNTFSANLTSGSGGGLYINGSTNTLTNNTLSANTGTAIYINTGTNKLDNNTLSANSGFNGGGIYMLSSTNTLTNNTLLTNTASNSGGGLYMSDCTNILTNNILSANSTQLGGGVYINAGFNTLTNNTFSANTASSNGGAIFI